ncbi:hypothetical protein M3Y96_00543900 [Aphelenchoides besseyi]|nr:hypothetical protein M3Y96_00543900 [Aphelenchoides besseyi]
MRFIFALIFATTFVLLVNCQSNDFSSLELKGMSEDDKQDTGMTDASNTKEAPNDANNEQQPKGLGQNKGKDGKEDGKQLDGADDKKGDTGNAKKGVCEDRKKRCNKKNCKKAKLRSLMKRDCANTCGFCPAVAKDGKDGKADKGTAGKGTNGKGTTGKGKGRGRGRRGKGRGKRGGKKSQTKPKTKRGGQPKKPKKQSEVLAR